ncbi:unnamed protein product, partial [Pylaiella littoralis]
KKGSIAGANQSTSVYSVKTEDNHGTDSSAASIERNPTSGATSMPPMFPSPSLSAASQVLIWTILVYTSYGGNVNPTALSSHVVPPPPPLEALAAGGAAVDPAGWTSLAMILNDGAIQKTVMIRNGADEAEVSAVITAGCREAGVTDDQASNIIHQWRNKQMSERKGYQRTGFMFENTGSKQIFE